jgi:thiamine pyrophosphate-dependent acetolactate synthase large subunit-like protein
MERWCAAWPVDVQLVNAGGAASFYALSHADLILTVQAHLTEGEGYGLHDFTPITAPVYELSSGFAGGAPAEMLKQLPLARDRVRGSRQRFIKRVTAKIFALEKMSARIARSGTRRQAPLNPAAVSHAICTAAPDGAVLLGEGNAAGMWMWSYNGMRPTLYPDRMATTGLLLPWILGASRAAPTRPLWCFAGDGGLGYQPALFGALRETRANAVVFVFNNRSWSSMRLEEAVQLHGRRPGPALPQRDFADLAERFDCDGIRVETDEHLQAALRQARQPLDRPLVIDIAVTRDSAPLAGMTFALAGLDGVLRPMRARLVLGLVRACLSGRLPWRVPRMLLGMVLS